ncbi:Spy/CpxP family protein refolding chaperone [Thalassolituus sp. LLYu03]|uniref:Spy/CpxP family protein refolding chaperone n=1 Tax=Thalassolituus sp. LLYu03 TaxID=3421656 RepID=UPI003D2BEA4B
MNIKRMTSVLSAAACALVLTTAQAWAFDGKHREIDWEDELSLTDAQEDQIDSIEDNYHDKLRDLRQADIKPSEKREQAGELMRQMRDDIHAVLTPEQQGKAQELMRDQHAKMQRKLARQLGRELKLDDQQKDALQKKVADLKTDYEWPLDKEQRDSAMKDFDAAVQSVLTAEQSEKWSKMKEHQMGKFHHPDGDGPFAGPMSGPMGAPHDGPMDGPRDGHKDDRKGGKDDHRDGKGHDHHDDDDCDK